MYFFSWNIALVTAWNMYWKALWPHVGRNTYVYVYRTAHNSMGKKQKLSFLPSCLLISLILKIVLNCIVTPSEHFTSKDLPFTALCCFPVCPETRT